MTPTGRPVVIGEVLFDVFPDGSQVLGGAPFNVAWHLRGFGLRPLMVTRIGDDELGGQVVAAMNAWQMDTTGVQVGDEAATGRVQVELDRGVPVFDILDDQAYDRIDTDAAGVAVSDVEPALLYHGSLLARSDNGRDVLRTLGAVGAPVFVDVNLRDPWWRADVVRSLIAGARWVKLNDEELGRLCPRPTDGAADTGPEVAATDLARRDGCEHVVVTCGDRGAFVIADGTSIAGPPPAEVEVIDTVGAGDAFSAVWITGLMCGWPPGTSLVRALRFAAAVCGFRGATSSDRRLYDRELAEWGTQ